MIAESIPLSTLFEEYIPLQTEFLKIIIAIAIITFPIMVCIIYHCVKRLREIEAVNWLNKNSPKKITVTDVCNKKDNISSNTVNKIKTLSFQKIKNIFK